MQPSAMKSDDGARSGSLFNDVDFPKDDDGRVHHLSVREGEVANRIITVGDPTRAASLAAMLDTETETETKRYDSHRIGAFTTYTGTYDDIPVSIIATGMGYPNMDFVIRETRGVVQGPMVFIRFGSCGIIDPNVKPGSVCVCTQGSIMITRNVDAFITTLQNNNNKKKCVTATADDAVKSAADEHQVQNNAQQQNSLEYYYNFSLPVKSHEGLSGLLMECLNKQNIDRVIGGMNATCDSFYSSQGRDMSTNFDDKNDDLIAQVSNAYDNKSIVTMEMETFHLLHLAHCSAPSNKIAASAAVICVANRHTGEICETSVIRELETKGGRAVLQAITKFNIDE